MTNNQTLACVIDYLSQKKLIAKPLALLNFYKIALFLALFFVNANAVAHAEDYHFVGWFNAVVPGGGQFLLGNSWAGFEQATIEGSTFGIGYGLSAERHFTIDGVTEEYPYYTNEDRVNLNKPLLGSLLQEVGIKYHMVNVFDAYREAHEKYGGDAGQGIDNRATIELFKDPFRWEVVSSPWVWIPLLAVAGATALDYRSQVLDGQPRLQHLTSFSNSFNGFNQLALYPIGSGAPEEMFYRGFLQNEAYQVVRSPFFAIPISTLAFSFSHAPEDRLGAAAGGAYMGFLAFKNQGNLAESIAFHFWSVVILGVESLALTLHAQGTGTPIGTQVNLNF